MGLVCLLSQDRFEEPACHYRQCRQRAASTSSLLCG